MKQVSISDAAKQMQATQEQTARYMLREFTIADGDYTVRLISNFGPSGETEPGFCALLFGSVSNPAACHGSVETTRRAALVALAHTLETDARAEYYKSLAPEIQRGAVSWDLGDGT